MSGSAPNCTWPSVTSTVTDSESFSTEKAVPIARTCMPFTSTMKGRSGSFSTSKCACPGGEFHESVVSIVVHRNLRTFIQLHLRTVHQFVGVRTLWLHCPLPDIRQMSDRSPSDSAAKTSRPPRSKMMAAAMPNTLTKGHRISLGDSWCRARRSGFGSFTVVWVSTAQANQNPATSRSVLQTNQSVWSPRPANSGMLPVPLVPAPDRALQPIR